MGGADRALIRLRLLGARLSQTRSVGWGVGQPWRVPELDALRGVAIALVLVRHLPKIPAYDAVSAWPVTLIVQSGWMGVDLFFVLSGFLISGLLYREYLLRDRIEIGRFLVRRGLKIWPLYVVFFGLVLAAKIAREFTGTSVFPTWRLQEALPNLFFLHNYFGPNPFNHSWSLAVEEHFYLALPVALWLLLISNNKRPARGHPLRLVPALTGVVAVGALVLRVAILPGRSFDMATHFYPTHFRIDSLMFGVFLGYLYHFQPQMFASLQRHKTALLMVGGLLVSPPLFWPPAAWPIWSVGFTSVYLGFGLILVAVLDMHYPVRMPFRRPLRLLAQGFAFLGVYSYAIYLCHPYAFSLPFASHVVRWINAVQLSTTLTWLIQATFYMAVAIAFGYLLSVTIERPFLLWRDRRIPSKAGRGTERVCAHCEDPIGTRGGAIRKLDQVMEP